MSRQFTARKLDVRAFAEEGVALTGSDPVAAYPRLLEETQGRGGAAPVEWTATGELRNPRHVQPQVWMHLEAHASLSLTCQRCLSPIEVPVDVDRVFRFVADESTAAAEDDESEEDLLALSRTFDLVELVEDELLMEMPLSPHHVACPAVSVEVADESFDGETTRRENPFAQLARLKPGGKPDGE